MKILHIITQKPCATGSGTYLTGLIRAFDDLDIQQYLIFGINKGDRESLPLLVNDFHTSAVEFKGRDLDFPVTGMSDVMPYENTRYKDLSKNNRGKLVQVFLRKTQKAIEEFKPDLILCQHQYLVTSYVAKYIKEKYPQIKIMAISHGTDLRQLEFVEETREEIIEGLNSLDKLLYLHEDQVAKMVDLSKGKILKEKMVVIGSGYDSYIFNNKIRLEKAANCNKEKRELRLIFTGKITRAKGIFELLEAIDKIQDRIKVHLTLIGSTANKKEFEEILKIINKLSYEVEFKGQLSQKELVHEYVKGDIFILPSYFEGLPLVLCEAMATGLKAIVTDLPGIKDWLCEFNEDLIFIPRPSMETLDSPTKEGKIKFIKDISEAILKATTSFDLSSYPDMTSLDWKSLANKIIELP